MPLPHWDEQFSFPQSGESGLNVRVRLFADRLRPKAVVYEAKLMEAMLKERFTRCNDPKCGGFQVAVYVWRLSSGAPRK
jgi:hypothetical protein